MRIEKLINKAAKKYRHSQQQELERRRKPVILEVSNQFRRLFGRNFRHFLGGGIAHNVVIGENKSSPGWKFDIEYETRNGTSRHATVQICIRIGTVYILFTGTDVDVRDGYRLTPESKFDLKTRLKRIVATGD